MQAMRAVFTNPERCIGCLQCEIACAIEHSISQDGARAFLESPVPRKRIHVEPGPVPTTAFPNQCRHCNPAPCQQVCPTDAIVFGDLNDPKSRVAQRASNERTYRVLDDLGTRPNVSYLKKVRHGQPT